MERHFLAMIGKHVDAHGSEAPLAMRGGRE